MIELYYTGSIKEGIEQTNYSKSLGGYISASKVPNGSFNNLFSSISLLGKNNILEELINFEMIGLGLKNVLPSTLQNVNIWVEKGVDAIANFEIAIVNTAVDTNGNFIEKINNRNSLPYYATFFNITGIENKKNIGNMAGGKIYGFWIKRIINKENITLSENNQTLYDKYKLNGNQNPSSKEIISLKIDWE